ncbi:helix-turn-helix domain-containing protein [Magnetospirillum sp. UT-4]|uniref:helix-turn-helix domain-containing protein n=1 Tax=Magnetospirillum sp. UT-4 TaxID=2681467 RepID=UPI00137EFEF0|nr:helix-turn-helix transcriptional regulator [Magnetospirillum sp. UT-4]CAA7627015.1 hypothetical protein MTBUT4_90054 [Magnetospirillum sp. UT-4]
MTSFLFRLDPRKTKAAQFVAKVRRELQQALAEEEKHGLTKSRIAEKLGIHRSAITRRLQGTENLTLHSLSDLAWAMNRDIVFRLERPMPKGNEPAWTAVVDGSRTDTQPVIRSVLLMGEG